MKYSMSNDHYEAANEKTHPDACTVAPDDGIVVAEVDQNIKNILEKRLRAKFSTVNFEVI